MRTWILFGFGISCCVAPLMADGVRKVKEHWSVLGEFVYMKRTKVHGRGIVKNFDRPRDACGCSHFTVINTEDLVHDFEFEPGYRASLTYMPSAKNSFEGIFLYLQPWNGEKEAHGRHNLNFPFHRLDYSFDFTKADGAHAHYESHFWDAEFNYWRNFTPRRVNYFALSGIAGLRYFHLKESFKLSMVRPPDKSTYNTHTWNHVYGLQVGLDFQMNPTHWLSWEAFAKVGGFANDTKERQFLGDFDNRVTLRHSERAKWESGFFADVAAQLGFRFLKYFYLHGGYEMMFLSGLAIAPEQVNRGVRREDGKKVRANGNALIHGLFAGLTASF